MTPADEYKRIVGTLTEGFDDDAARNAERVAELKQAVKALGKRLVEASEQLTVARVGNILAWEDALEILWVEQWMSMRPFPRPNREADPAPEAEIDPETAAQAVAAVEARVADLRAEVARGPLGLPRP